jgi:hypothetical protein
MIHGITNFEHFYACTTKCSEIATYAKFHGQVGVNKLRVSDISTRSFVCDNPEVLDFPTVMVKVRVSINDAEISEGVILSVHSIFD